MKCKDKVSIIIPIYNVEEYLMECLDSILKQTYTNLELVLIDDGSKDASGNICDQYAANDSRIKVLHKKNGGVSAARNSGLEMSSGEMITFVDPDDWIEPETIEKMVCAIAENQAEVSACRFHTEIIDKNLREFYQPLGVKTGTGDDTINYMFQYPAYGTMVWNKMFRREAIFKQKRQFKHFDESLDIGEDELWLIEVLKNVKKVVYLDEELYYWRVRENSLYRKNLVNNKTFTDIIAQEKALALLKNESKYSMAYSEIMERLNAKIFKCSVGAYINNQKDFYMELTRYRKKYVNWYRSDKISKKSKFKRRMIYLAMDMRLSKRFVLKLYQVK